MNDEEEKADNLQVAGGVGNDERNSEDGLEAPQVLETGNDNKFVVSVDDADIFLSDKMLESIKLSDQHAKLVNDHTRLKDKYCKVITDNRLSSVRLEEMYNKMRSSDDQKRKFESELNLAKSEIERLEQHNEKLTAENRCTARYQERSRVAFLKYQNCSNALLESKVKLEKAQEKQNQLMGMVKDMLTSSSEDSKKIMHWKGKLEECKNENKMMKKHWNEIVRIIADISRKCCDDLPPTISQRVDKLPLDELLQIGRSGGDSDDEAADEVHRLLNVDISKDSTRSRSTGRGRGGRGRSKSMGRVVDERMHEDLIARKLHRNDADETNAAPCDPVAKSVMGRKTETVREQQERQRAGFKDKVAQMKKEYKAMQSDDSQVVDSHSTPSMEEEEEEEDRLMICDDEEQSDVGVDHFNPIDNKDDALEETPRFDDDMNMLTIVEKNDEFQMDDEPCGSMYDNVKRRKSKPVHKETSQGSLRISDTSTTPKPHSSLASSRRETIDYIPLGRGSRPKNQSAKHNEEKMVPKSFVSSNVLKMNKEKGRDTDESIGKQKNALPSKEPYQMVDAYVDAAPLDDVADLPIATPTSNTMNRKLAQEGADKHGIRKGRCSKEEERRKTSQALFGEMSDSEDDDVIEEETKKDDEKIGTEKDEGTNESEKKLDEGTNESEKKLDEGTNESEKKMEDEIKMDNDIYEITGEMETDEIGATTSEEKNEEMEEETGVIEGNPIDEKEEETVENTVDIEEKKVEFDKDEGGTNEDNEETNSKIEEMMEQKKEDDGMREEELVMKEDEAMEEEKEEEGRDTEEKEENEDEKLIENVARLDEIEMGDTPSLPTKSEPNIDKPRTRREKTDTSIKSTKLSTISPTPSAIKSKKEIKEEEVDEESYEMEEHSAYNTDVSSAIKSKNEIKEEEMDEEFLIGIANLRRSSRTRKQPTFFATTQEPPRSQRRGRDDSNRGRSVARDKVDAATPSKQLSRSKSVARENQASSSKSRAKSTPATPRARAKSVAPTIAVPKTSSATGPMTPATVDKRSRSKSVAPITLVPTTPAPAVPRTRSKSVAPVKIEHTSPSKNVPKTPAKTVPKTPSKNVPKTPSKNVPKTSSKNVPKTPAKNVPKTPAKTIPKTPAKTAPKTPAKTVPKTPSKTEKMGSERQKRDEISSKGTSFLDEFHDDEMESSPSIGDASQSTPSLVSNSNEMATSSFNGETTPSLAFVPDRETVANGPRPQKRKSSVASSMATTTGGRGRPSLRNELEARIWAGQSVDISTFTKEQITTLGVNALENIPIRDTWDVVIETMNMNKDVIDINDILPKEEGKVFEWLINVKDEHEDILECVYNVLKGHIDLSTLSDLTTPQVTSNVRCIFMALSFSDLHNKTKETRKLFLDILQTRSPLDVCQCLTFLLMRPPTALLAMEILKTKMDDADNIGKLLSMHMSGNKNVDVLSWACTKFTDEQSNSLDGAAFKMPTSVEMVERWWESEMEIVEESKGLPEAHSTSRDAATVFNNLHKNVSERMSSLISPRFEIEGLDRIKLFDQLVTPVFDMIDDATSNDSIGSPTRLAMNEGRLVALKMHITMKIVKSCCSHQMGDTKERDYLSAHVYSLLERTQLILKRPICTSIYKSSFSSSVAKTGLEIAILSLANDWNILTRACIHQPEPAKKKARK